MNLENKEKDLPLRGLGTLACIRWGLAPNYFESRLTYLGQAMNGMLILTAATLCQTAIRRDYSYAVPLPAAAASQGLPQRWDTHYVGKFGNTLSSFSHQTETETASLLRQNITDKNPEDDVEAPSWGWVQPEVRDEKNPVWLVTDKESKEQYPSFYSLLSHSKRDGFKPSRDKPNGEPIVVQWAGVKNQSIIIDGVPGVTRQKSQMSFPQPVAGNSLPARVSPELGRTETGYWYSQVDVSTPESSSFRLDRPTLTSSDSFGKNQSTSPTFAENLETFTFVSTLPKPLPQSKKSVQSLLLHSWDEFKEYDEILHKRKRVENVGNKVAHRRKKAVKEQPKDLFQKDHPLAYPPVKYDDFTSTSVKTSVKRIVKREKRNFWQRFNFFKKRKVAKKRKLALEKRVKKSISLEQRYVQLISSGPSQFLPLFSSSRLAQAEAQCRWFVVANDATIPTELNDTTIPLELNQQPNLGTVSQLSRRQPPLVEPVSSFPSYLNTKLQFSGLRRLPIKKDVATHDVSRIHFFRRIDPDNHALNSWKVLIPASTRPMSKRRTPQRSTKMDSHILPEVEMEPFLSLDKGPTCSRLFTGNLRGTKESEASSNLVNSEVSSSDWGISQLSEDSCSQEEKIQGMMKLLSQRTLEIRELTNNFDRAVATPVWRRYLRRPPENLMNSSKVGNVEDTSSRKTPQSAMFEKSHDSAGPLEETMETDHLHQLTNKHTQSNQYTHTGVQGKPPVYTVHSEKQDFDFEYEPIGYHFLDPLDKDTVAMPGQRRWFSRFRMHLKDDCLSTIKPGLPAGITHPFFLHDSNTLDLAEYKEFVSHCLNYQPNVGSNLNTLAVGSTLESRKKPRLKFEFNPKLLRKIQEEGSPDWDVTETQPKIDLEKIDWKKIRWQLDDSTINNLLNDWPKYSNKEFKDDPYCGYDNADERFFTSRTGAEQVDSLKDPKGARYQAYFGPYRLYPTKPDKFDVLVPQHRLSMITGQELYRTRRACKKVDRDPDLELSTTRNVGWGFYKRPIRLPQWFAPTEWDSDDFTPNTQLEIFERLPEGQSNDLKAVEMLLEEIRPSDLKHVKEDDPLYSRPFRKKKKLMKTLKKKFSKLLIYSVHQLYSNEFLKRQKEDTIRSLKGERADTITEFNSYQGNQMIRGQIPYPGVWEAENRRSFAGPNHMSESVKMTVEIPFQRFEDQREEIAGKVPDPFDYSLFNPPIGPPIHNWEKKWKKSQTRQWEKFQSSDSSWELEKELLEDSPYEYFLKKTLYLKEALLREYFAGGSFDVEYFAKNYYDIFASAKPLQGVATVSLTPELVDDDGPSFNPQEDDGQFILEYLSLPYDKDQTNSVVSNKSLFTKPNFYWYEDWDHIQKFKTFDSKKPISTPLTEGNFSNLHKKKQFLDHHAELSLSSLTNFFHFFSHEQDEAIQKTIEQHPEYHYDLKNFNRDSAVVDHPDLFWDGYKVDYGHYRSLSWPFQTTKFSLADKFEPTGKGWGQNGGVFTQGNPRPGELQQLIRMLQIGPNSFPNSDGRSLLRSQFVPGWNPKLTSAWQMQLVEGRVGYKRNPTFHLSIFKQLQRRQQDAYQDNAWLLRYLVHSNVQGFLSYTTRIFAFQPIRSIPLLAFSLGKLYLLACLCTFALSGVRVFIETYDNIFVVKRKSPVTGRVIYPSENSIRLCDVAGLDFIQQDIDATLYYLRSNGRLLQRGALAPNTFLLVGPPGIGKTLFVRAISGDSRCILIATSSAQLLDFDETKRSPSDRIVELFDFAKTVEPCILFFDEVDSIGGTRLDERQWMNADGYINEASLTFGSVRIGALTQLLCQLDGAGAKKRSVVVFGSTNRVEVLDPALLRDGRFDRLLWLMLPAVTQRLEVLRKCSGLDKGLGLSPDVSWSRLAYDTQGYTGSDLATLIKESARYAVLHGLEHSVQSITWGRDSIIGSSPMFSVKRDQLLQTPAMAIRWAFYQAGGCLARTLLIYLQPELTRSLVPQQETRRFATRVGVGGVLADNAGAPTNRFGLEVEGYLITLLAGRAAVLIPGWGGKANFHKSCMSEIAMNDVTMAMKTAHVLALTRKSGGSFYVNPRSALGEKPHINGLRLLQEGVGFAWFAAMGSKLKDYKKKMANMRSQLGLGRTWTGNVYKEDTDRGHTRYDQWQVEVRDLWYFPVPKKRVNRTRFSDIKIQRRCRAYDKHTRLWKYADLHAMSNERVVPLWGMWAGRSSMDRAFGKAHQIVSAMPECLDRLAYLLLVKGFVTADECDAAVELYRQRTKDPNSIVAVAKSDKFKG